MADAIAIKATFSKELSCFFKTEEGKQLKSIAHVLDSVGNKTKTILKRVTAQQTGVSIAKVGKTLTSHTVLGKGGAVVRGEYEIVCRDVTLSLKEFKPKQGYHGVSAKPWGTPHFFDNSFIGPGGHVYQRSKYGVRRGPRPVHSQLPIRKLWGPAIPKEMVKDKAEQAFYDTVAKLIGPAIEAKLHPPALGSS